MEARGFACGFREPDRRRPSPNPPEVCRRRAALRRQAENQKRFHLGSRRVPIAGIIDHPDASWMNQVARNARLEELGYLHCCRYVLQDRDAKFCAEFRETLAAGRVKCLRLPRRSPNLDALAERWVRSVKEECLSKLILRCATHASGATRGTILAGR